MWASDMQHLFILAAPYSDTKSGAMEIDTSGNVIWYRVYDHIPLPDAIFRGGYINGAWPTPDGRLLMVGTTNTDINAKYSWMIIADSNGCRSDNDPSCWPLSIPGVTKNTSVHIYPNPTSDMLHVDNIKTGTRLQLLDLYGRSLYINTATGTMALIDMSGLPVANYLLQLTDVEGTRSSYKVLKQ
jgi:hypothetical protein